MTSALLLVFSITIIIGFFMGVSLDWLLGHGGKKK